MQLDSPNLHAGSRVNNDVSTEERLLQLYIVSLREGLQILYNYALAKH